MIKPWLSKNFLHMMQWSNVRDYPPKLKKPWLFDNFMEMEEVNAGHLELLPGASPIAIGDVPLPPSPDIPQDPEEDPCAGPRNLWVIANPPVIDCEEGDSITLIISPDFKCIEITQAFYKPGDVKVIVEDDRIRLEHQCYPEEPEPVILWVCDCLCGGCSAISISFVNCGGEPTGYWVFDSTWRTSYPNCCQNFPHLESGSCISGIYKFEEVFACDISEGNGCLDTCEGQPASKCGVPPECGSVESMFRQTTLIWECVP